MNKALLKAIAMVVVVVFALGFAAKRGWIPSPFV